MSEKVDCKLKNLCSLAFILFLQVLLLLILIGGLFLDSQKCEMTIDQADQCGKRITFFGDEEMFIPQNEEDMEKHCQLMFDSIKCLGSFGKNCLPSFPQQAFKIYTYDMLHVISHKIKF